MRAVPTVLVFVVGCGRVAFDTIGDATDAAALDAALAPFGPPQVVTELDGVGSTLYFVRFNAGEAQILKATR